MSDSLQSHGLKHTRLSCPLLSPRTCSDSCPLSQWCHPTISSSVVHLLLLPSIFPSLRVFSNEAVFALSGQSIGASASASVFPMSEYSGLISFRIDRFDLLALQGTLKRLLSTTIQKHQFFGTSGPTLTSYLYLFFLRKIFWACHEACGIPVPWPGIESGPSSVKESQPLDCQGIPLVGFLVRKLISSIKVVKFDHSTPFKNFFDCAGSLLWHSDSLVALWHVRS